MDKNLKEIKKTQNVTKTKKKKKDSKIFKKAEFPKNLILVDNTVYKKYSKKKSKSINKGSINSFSTFDISSYISSNNDKLDNYMQDGYEKIGMGSFIRKVTNGFVPLTMGQLTDYRVNTFCDDRKNLSDSFFKKKWNIYSDAKIDNFIDVINMRNDYLSRNDEYSFMSSSCILSKMQKKIGSYSLIINHIVALYELDELDFTQKTPEVAFCKRHNIRFTTFADAVYALRCNNKITAESIFSRNSPSIFSMVNGRFVTLYSDKRTDGRIYLYEYKYDQYSGVCYVENIYDMNDIIMNYNSTFMVVLDPVNIDENHENLDMELYNSIKNIIM